MWKELQDGFRWKIIEHTNVYTNMQIIYAQIKVNVNICLLLVLYRISQER